VVALQVGGLSRGLAIPHHKILYLLPRATVRRELSHSILIEFRIPRKLDGLIKT
jgi:hypothetical protein